MEKASRAELIGMSVPLCGKEAATQLHVLCYRTLLLSFHLPFLIVVFTPTTDQWYKAHKFLQHEATLLTEPPKSHPLSYALNHKAMNKTMSSIGQAKHYEPYGDTIQ